MTAEPPAHEDDGGHDHGRRHRRGGGHPHEAGTRALLAVLAAGDPDERIRFGDVFGQ